MVPGTLEGLRRHCHSSSSIIVVREKRAKTDRVINIGDEINVAVNLRSTIKTLLNTVIGTNQIEATSSQKAY